MHGTKDVSKYLKEKVMNYEFIRIEVKGRVGVIAIDRAAKLNALCDQLLDELGTALNTFEADSEIGCIVLTGSAKAFAAGADISGFAAKTYMDMYKADEITRNWEQLRYCRKPVIAAVAGYAFGGGCELAMMCDFIIAADNAVFAQPEIGVGVLPGAGGTQRLPRAIGKAKAMDICLTGRKMNAAEAERAGLVSRVVPLAQLMEETIDAAEKIASYSLPIAMMIKENINRSFESSLAEGLLFERRQFHSVFALADQKEGAAAFLEKRPANFTHC